MVSIIVYIQDGQINIDAFLPYYSLMQSDGNSLSGDVVLDSFNMLYRDEDSILYQKYGKQISWDLFHKFFWSD